LQPINRFHLIPSILFRMILPAQQAARHLTVRDCEAKFFQNGWKSYRKNATGARKILTVEMACEGTAAASHREMQLISPPSFPQPVGPSAWPAPGLY
jgi:hypothetical protein